METKFCSTAVGSMPMTDADDAVQILLKYLDAPAWPQLPKRGLREQMEIQYSEGLPCVVAEPEKHRIYFDTSGETSEALADFYEKYITAIDTGESLDWIAISPDYAAGIDALEKALIARNGRCAFLKAQTTGPCSFALVTVDEHKRAIYYNEEFREVIVKALALKCRWQLQKFRPYADQLICFIDEPILSAFGSSTYVSVRREDIVAMLAEMVEAVHAEGALAGVHCCGNTEWSILVDAGADIINFDAFAYGDTIAMYPDAIQTHLARGGILAYGMVPTSAAIREQTVESMEARLENLMDQLAAKGISKEMITRQAMLTPSCGTGTLSAEDAKMVFSLLAQLTRRMKEKYGF